MPKRRPRVDRTIESAIEEFGNKAEINKTNSLSLDDLSLNELAKQYKEIDRQSHILKGKIILSARARFNSDREFGLWLSEYLPDLNQKQAHRLMCIAEFFDERNQRSMEGIRLSACYELSAPQHREVAEKIYQEIAGKNYPLSIIKDKLYKNKNKAIAVNSDIKINNQLTNSVNNEFKYLVNTIINNILANISSADSIDILKECINSIERNSR